MNSKLETASRNLSKNDHVFAVRQTLITLRGVMVCHVELGSASIGLEQFSAATAQGRSKLIAPRSTIPISVDNRIRRAILR
jgi:hypothetical protein